MTRRRRQGAEGARSRRRRKEIMPPIGRAETTMDIVTLPVLAIGCQARTCHQLFLHQRHEVEVPRIDGTAGRKRIVLLKPTVLLARFHLV